MAYIVTHNAGMAAAIDRDFDLDGALAHACQLLAQGKVDVAIQTGSGLSIRGDDLLACCEGRKRLTADLRAI